MNFITILVIFTISYYMMYFVSILIFPKKRKEIVTKNTKLDEMRKVSFKTLTEQKEFINTKFPKQKPNWFKRFFTEGLFIIGFVILVRFLFIKFNIEFSPLEGIVMIAGVLITTFFVLRPYRLQNTDIDAFLKW